MKKQVTFFIAGSIIFILSSSFEIAHASTESEQVIYSEKKENSTENELSNRIGFFNKKRKIIPQPLLGQTVDFSSGIKLQKKYPAYLDDKLKTSSYLGLTYYNLSGTLIFGRR